MASIIGGLKGTRYARGGEDGRDDLPSGNGGICGGAGGGAGHGDDGDDSEDEDDYDWNSLSTGSSQDDESSDGDQSSLIPTRGRGRSRANRARNPRDNRWSEAETDALIFQRSKFKGQRLPTKMRKQITRRHNRWLRESGLGFQRTFQKWRQKWNDIEMQRWRAKQHGLPDPFPVPAHMPLPLRQPPPTRKGKLEAVPASQRSNSPPARQPAAPRAKARQEEPRPSLSPEDSDHFSDSDDSEDGLDVEAIIRAQQGKK